MKKVGILSKQKIINYGSFLQAYALKKLIEGTGSQVYFVDIVPGRQLPGQEFKETRLRKLKTALQSILHAKFFEKLGATKLKGQITDQFNTTFFSMLGTDKKPEKLDVVIIGSDEVFNACEIGPQGFSSQLFGANLSASRIATYAGSFGYTTMQLIEKFRLTDEIKMALQHASFLSVRDENSLNIMKQLTDQPCHLHLDPVLIYDYSLYIKDTTRVVEKDYIIVYTYPDRITNDEKNAIAEFARKNKKRLYSIGCYYSWCHKALLPQTPFEVLSYFAAADFIITDTFHGAIFSIITHRNFCTIIRNSNTQKLTFLLKQLKQDDRIAGKAADIETILATPPDFSETDEIISQERASAHDYLTDVLS